MVRSTLQYIDIPKVSCNSDLPFVRNWSIFIVLNRKWIMRDRSILDPFKVRSIWCFPHDVSYFLSKFCIIPTYCLWNITFSMELGSIGLKWSDRSRTMYGIMGDRSICAPFRLRWIWWILLMLVTCFPNFVSFRLTVYEISRFARSWKRLDWNDPIY